MPAGTEEILRVIKSRHRPESEYKVDNLTDVLQVAEKTANAFTLILLLFAVVTLIVGGVGIMNIMLATVSTRIREIGIRKAVGATRIEIELQFLTEAVLISLVGGIVGTLIGLAIPFSLRLFTDTIPADPVSRCADRHRGLVLGRNRVRSASRQTGRQAGSHRVVATRIAAPTIAQ